MVAARRPRTKTRARLDVDERRAQLVALALELFSETSYEQVSIDDIARAAGMSKGLLYHYFKTKRHFYLAGLRESSRRLLAVCLVEREGTPAEQLAAGLDAYLAYVERHAPAFLALFRGGLGADKAVAKIIDDTRARLAARLLEGALLVNDSPLARAAVRGWIGMVEAASIEWLTEKGADRAALRELLVEVLVTALTVASRPPAKAGRA